MQELAFILLTYTKGFRTLGSSLNFGFSFQKNRYGIYDEGIIHELHAQVPGSHRLSIFLNKLFSH